MGEVEITKMSSRGQIVIPQSIRDKMGLREGEAFAVVRNSNTLLFKKTSTPSMEDIIAEWGHTE